MKKIGVLLIVVLMLSLISVGLLLGAEENDICKKAPSCARDRDSNCKSPYGVKKIITEHNFIIFKYKSCQCVCQLGYEGNDLDEIWSVSDSGDSGSSTTTPGSGTSSGGSGSGSSTTSGTGDSMRSCVTSADGVTTCSGTGTQTTGTQGTSTTSGSSTSGTGDSKQICVKSANGVTTCSGTGTSSSTSTSGGTSGGSSTSSTSGSSTSTSGSGTSSSGSGSALGSSSGTSGGGSSVGSNSGSSTTTSGSGTSTSTTSGTSGTGSSGSEGYNCGAGQINIGRDGIHQCRPEGPYTTVDGCHVRDSWWGNGYDSDGKPCSIGPSLQACIYHHYEPEGCEKPESIGEIKRVSSSGGTGRGTTSTTSGSGTSSSGSGSSGTSGGGSSVGSNSGSSTSGTFGSLWNNVLGFFGIGGGETTPTTPTTTPGSSTTTSGSSTSGSGTSSSGSGSGGTSGGGSSGSSGSGGGGNCAVILDNCGCPKGCGASSSNSQSNVIMLPCSLLKRVWCSHVKRPDCSAKGACDKGGILKTGNPCTSEGEKKGYCICKCTDTPNVALIEERNKKRCKWDCSGGSGGQGGGGQGGGGQPGGIQPQPRGQGGPAWGAGRVDPLLNLPADIARGLGNLFNIGDNIPQQPDAQVFANVPDNTPGQPLGQDPFAEGVAPDSDDSGNAYFNVPPDIPECPNGFNSEIGKCCLPGYLYLLQPGCRGEKKKDNKDTIQIKTAHIGF